MNKNVAALASILIALAAVTGCVSEQEKRARRACALDVAGDYTEARTDGAATGTIAIADESSKTDVKLSFTRGALYDGEQAFIDRIKSDSDKAAVKAALTFGQGDNLISDDLVGGENYSDDFGASSTVGVSTPAMTAVVDESDASDPTVQYNLNLAINNGTDKLTGTLLVTFSEQRPNATDGKTEDHSESKSFPISFTRNAGVLQEDQSADCKAAVDGNPDNG